jgi:hypothetical protein
MTMATRPILAILAAAAVLTGGCLLKDVTHTWYLDETGAVTWVVIEKDVRSDARSPVDRQDEELAYYAAVKAGNHPAARGLRALGAGQLRTRILRSELPYTVVTEGRFANLEELGQRMITMSGLAGTSVVTRTGNTLEWTFSVRDPHAEDVKPNEDVSALMGDLDTLQVVLARGHFESAQLFDISSDRRVATFDESQLKDADENAVVVLRLKWKRPEY